MIFNLLLVATVLSSVSAVPAPQTGLPDDGTYRWKLTNLAADCFRTRCTFKFSVTGDEFNGIIPPFGGIIPAFSGDCEGTYSGFPFDQRLPGDFDTCKCTMKDDPTGNKKFFLRVTDVQKLDDLELQGRFQFKNAEGQTFNFTSARDGPAIETFVPDPLTLNLDGIDAVEVPV